MKLPIDWRESIELMHSHGVEYVVVGGHAVGYHGYPRYTGDIDFFVRPSEGNASRLIDTLVAFGFDEARQGSVAASMDGLPVRIIGREALLKNKRASGRTKDLADAEEIEKTHPRQAGSG